MTVEVPIYSQADFVYVTIYKPGIGDNKQYTGFFRKEEKVEFVIKHMKGDYRVTFLVVMEKHL